VTRLQRLSRDEALECGADFFFDQIAADHACEFFPTFLRHTIGKFAGRPFELQEWQRVEVVEELFGWRRVDNGFRRYRIGYIEVPKKNGKSTLLAGIGLYLLCADGEFGAQVYGAAADRKQAALVFDEAVRCITLSDPLKLHLRPVPSTRTITFQATSSFYRVISADARLAEGLNIHGLLFDELHAQRNRRLWSALRYGGAARDQPMLLAITTAGVDRNSICFEQRKYAERVLADWRVDPTFFPFIRAASPEDDWRSPVTWRKANPSFGVTFNEEDFAAEAREADSEPTKLNEFLRYRLNIWTQQDSRWIKPDAWAACRGNPTGSIDGRECWVGVDLAWSQDTTAVVAIFPDADGTFDVLARIYLAEDLIPDHERRDGAPYGQWAEDGHVVKTQGDVTDYEFIRRDIEALAKKHVVRMIAVDPHNATHITNQLDAGGYPIKRYQQGFAGMNAPCRHLETLIANQRIRHNSPALDWQANNVAIRTSADGLIRPLKPQPKSPARVDGILALCMALGAWIDGGQEKPKPRPRPRCR
jgi:phage terminase large subunit-like protein